MHSWIIVRPLARHEHHHQTHRYVVVLIATTSLKFATHPQLTGPSFTKAQALTTFIKTTSRVDAMLLQLLGPGPLDDKRDTVTQQANACGEVTRRSFTKCLNAARACFQRLSVAVRVCDVAHVCAFAFVCGVCSFASFYRFYTRIWPWRSMSCVNITTRLRFSSYSVLC